MNFISTANFDERQVKRETRFRALILVEVVLQKRIATSARAGIVERLTKVVAPEEPLKAPPRRRPPEIVTRDRVSL